LNQKLIFNPFLTKNTQKKKNTLEAVINLSIASKNKKKIISKPKIENLSELRYVF